MLRRTERLRWGGAFGQHLRYTTVRLRTPENLTDMIQVRGLTKYYGDHAAIRDLNFDIASGEVIGFLGRNGAGKTTTLKVLGCVLLPTSGTATVDGVDVVANAHAVRAKIGFLPDTPPLYNEMSVGDFLRFAAELRGVPSRQAAAKVVEAEEKMDLREMHDAPISSLSHGYRQRVGVAQALVHQPALLILDEPTSGLDPIQIVEMRDLIRRLRGQHTVLISSHFLAEISQTCDRLLVIQRGEIVAQGSEDDLAESRGKSAIELTLRGKFETARAALSILPGVVEVNDNDPVGAIPGEVNLRIRAETDLRAELVRASVAAGLDVLRIDRAASRLESLFIELSRESTSPASTGDAS
jgi:ABC-2 type transport system ATP-binding protein